MVKSPKISDLINSIKRWLLIREGCCFVSHHHHQFKNRPQELAMPKWLHASLFHFYSCHQNLWINLHTHSTTWDTQHGDGYQTLSSIHSLLLGVTYVDFQTHLHEVWHSFTLALYQTHSTTPFFYRQKEYFIDKNNKKQWVHDDEHIETKGAKRQRDQEAILRETRNSMLEEQSKEPQHWGQSKSSLIKIF